MSVLYTVLRHKTLQMILLNLSRTSS
uniref:Uncharacterized protein n=1 Tax=Anguilla anguilla TaxID=7936 RepID=A0A0E9R506_ANGAN